MLSTRSVLFFLTLAAVFAVSYATDPDPLQDFCVGFNDSNFAVYVNGKFCKNPRLVTPEDFFYSGLDRVGNTSNQLGSHLNQVFHNQLRGLNHQGVGAVRIDLAPRGLNPLHSHPRASEIIIATKGVIYVGFIGSNPSDPTQSNKLYAKILYPGDMYVFPRGLIHFQYNIGKTNAVAYAGFNSQNPGVVTVASSIFGSEPRIDPELLAKAFQMDVRTVEYLQSRTWIRNN